MMNRMMMIPPPEVPVSVELGRVDSPSDVLGPGGEYDGQIRTPALRRCGVGLQPRWEPADTKH